MGEPSAELIALNGAASLQRIEFLELHARRNETVPAPSDEPVEVDPKYGLGVEQGRGKEFRLRLRITLDATVGDIVVEAAAYYDAEAYEAELDQGLLLDYANQVGIMALIPYLRHAIADLTQRVFGLPLLMPIMQRGEVTFDEADMVEAASE